MLRNSTIFAVAASEAVAGDVRLIGAALIPFDDAAEEAQRADLLAAFLVVAAGRAIRLAAVALTRARARRRTATEIAADLRGSLGTKLVPFGLAAERVGRADGGAAGRVLATGGAVAFQARARAGAARRIEAAASEVDQFGPQVDQGRPRLGDSRPAR